MEKGLGLADLSINCMSCKQKVESNYTCFDCFSQEKQQNATLVAVADAKDKAFQSEKLQFEKDSEQKDAVIFDLRNKLDELEKDIIQQKDDFVMVSSKNAELEEQKSNIEIKAETAPSLSIQMDSLLDLNQPQGWSIKSANLEKVKDKKMVTVSVVGMYDVGKSWFCNEFTGKNLFTSGINQRTASLDCHFPTDESNLIGLIDTPGSNEAIRCTNKVLVEKVEAAHVKESNYPQPKDSKGSQENDRTMFHYKILKNDAKILQDLKEKFIGEVSDVLILICNKLSEKEQESIFKVIKHHNRIAKERIRQQDQTDGFKRRETLFYIIHNYKMLTEKSQVEDQIKRDLNNSFKIEQVPLFCAEEPKYANHNNMMYKDQFGIGHLILAGKGTNAGKYYNPSTFGYLKGKISHIENRTSADVKKLFLDFCNQNLRKVLRQEKIVLKLNAEGSAIVKEIDSPNVVLEDLRYDEFGDFSVSTAFEPRYSVVERKKDTGKIEVVVEMELIDSKFEASVKREKKGEKGCWCLFVKGDKACPADSASKSMRVKQDRERGEFVVKVKLLNLDKPTVTRVPPKEGTIDGIVQWTFDFNSPDEDMPV